MWHCKQERCSSPSLFTLCELDDERLRGGKSAYESRMGPPPLTRKTGCGWCEAEDDDFRRCQSAGQLSPPALSLSERGAQLGIAMVWLYNPVCLDESAWLLRQHSCCYI